MIKDQSGFSLIEIILVLLLLGIMGAVGVLGISNVVSGFMLSRDAAALAAKGQLAMLRLSREFRVITSVDSTSSDSSITFIAFHGYKQDGTTPDNKTYTVKIDNTIASISPVITLNDSAIANSNDILVDQVKSLAFAYYDSYDDVSPKTTWTEGSSTIIQVTLVLNGPNASSCTFSTRVRPRNI